MKEGLYMHKYTIMPMDIDHINEICEDIRQQYAEGIADLALFMVKLVPEGDPVLPKADIQCEKYDLFRDRLASMGLKCGILVQCTIGHGYKLTLPFPFQRYTRLTDGTTYDTVCPYDDAFCDYMRHSFSVIAAHNPEVIMVDDDLRLIQRSGSGCACPKHLKEFEKLYGAPLTREEIYSHVTKDTEESKYITSLFVKTQIDSLVQSARAMREGIDLVDKTIPGQYCTCGISAEGAAQIGSILAGEGNPIVVRVNNGNYTPAGARYLTDPFQKAAIEMNVMKSQGHVDVFLAETDTCPQNRYSTGAQSLHSHFTGTILEGAQGAKHWITRLGEFEPDSGKAYRKLLAKYSKFYEKLFEIVPTLSWHGCRAPLSTVPDYCFKQSSAINYWVHCVLERMGLPVYFSSQNGGAVFLGGDAPDNFTDAELTEMFSGTVILDGVAANKVQNRGLGDLLGVSIRPWTGIHPSVEIDCITGKKLGVQMDPLELIPQAGAVTASNVCSVLDGQNPNVLFPGCVIYKNANNGTAITFCGRVNTVFVYTDAFAFLNESRKRQLVRILQSTGNLPVYYPEDAEVYMKAAKMPDGSEFIAFFNIGLDPIEQIPLVCEKEVKAVSMLQPDGTITPCGFTANGNHILIDAPAYTLNPVILFLK